MFWKLGSFRTVAFLQPAESAVQNYSDCSNYWPPCVIFAYLEALHRKSLPEISSLLLRLGKTTVSKLRVVVGLLGNCSM